jgi:hypothetical protein
MQMQLLDGWILSHCTKNIVNHLGLVTVSGMLLAAAPVIEGNIF